MTYIRAKQNSEDEIRLINTLVELVLSQLDSKLYSSIYDAKNDFEDVALNFMESDRRFNFLTSISSECQSKLFTTYFSTINGNEYAIEIKFSVKYYTSPSAGYVYEA